MRVLEIEDEWPAYVSLASVLEKRSEAVKGVIELSPTALVFMKPSLGST